MEKLTSVPALVQNVLLPRLYAPNPSAHQESPESSTALHLSDYYKACRSCEPLPMPSPAHSGAAPHIQMHLLNEDYQYRLKKKLSKPNTNHSIPKLFQQPSTESSSKGPSFQLLNLYSDLLNKSSYMCTPSHSIHPISTWCLCYRKSSGTQGTQISKCSCITSSVFGVSCSLVIL